MLKSLLPLLVLLQFAGIIVGDEYVPVSANEPIAETMSLHKTAKSLDSFSVWWQEKYKCSQCHSNMMYLIARPSLDGVLKSDGKVRAFYEDLVERRWKGSGLRYDPESIVVAVPLAINDARTTGKLHPTTRKALDRMLSVQWPDGQWTFSQAKQKRGEVAGARNAFFRGYEQMLFAAIGISLAPDNYAASEAAQTALQRIRARAKKIKTKTPYQRTMLLWASTEVDGLLAGDQQAKIVEELLQLQRQDGGWSIIDINKGVKNFASEQLKMEPFSDAFATGFVVHALRKAEVPVDHPRIQRGVKWLKSNQRESGRWYVPSFNKRPNNVLTYSGTAYAILALDACGELPN